MKAKFSKAGAAALPVLMIAALVGIDYSGAAAQEATAEAANEGGMTAQLLPLDNVGEEALPRFTAAPEIEEEAEQPATLRELVFSVSSDAPLSPELYCLAGAIYFEARGEPVEGQLAVGQVVINRAESSAFPDDYCGVVTQYRQFSFVRGGVIPTPKKGSAAWRRAKALAQIAHQGLWDSAAQDSLYFHASYVRPSWSRKKIARARINTHIFYK